MTINVHNLIYLIREERLKKKLILLARHRWLWCIERSVCLSAAYVRGIENLADENSHKFKDNVE